MHIGYITDKQIIEFFAGTEKKSFARIQPASNDMKPPISVSNLFFSAHPVWGKSYVSRNIHTI